MLKFLRGRKRSRNVLLLVVVGVMTLSLGLFFSAWSGGAAGLLRGAGGNDTVVAKVGSYEVTAKELKDQLFSLNRLVVSNNYCYRFLLSSFFCSFTPAALSALPGKGVSVCQLCHRQHLIAQYKKPAPVARRLRARCAAVAIEERTGAPRRPASTLRAGCPEDCTRHRR